ncbi:Stromal membrane-associated protein 2 [Thelohanellus kitauei]|uniref:Stromal membrane-associated protein 2 n=1 Tax=Thelohanellus kitauei TaxID=669202 RepID=A0A0C2MSB6_THEKT|nr:Stromal membrane-associated protein 2 [Thelohanellus kitauei]
MNIGSKVGHNVEAVEIAQLSKMEGNNTCAECGVACPIWASCTIGVFICTRCASLHRSLGTHITRVKSITLDNWTREMVNSMKTKGNKLARMYYEEGLPKDIIRPTTDDTGMLKFIKNKYVNRKYVKSHLNYDEFLSTYGQSPTKPDDESAKNSQTQKTLVTNEKTATESKPKNPTASSQLNVLDELFGPIISSPKPKEVDQHPPTDIFSPFSQNSAGNSSSYLMNQSASNTCYNPFAAASPSASSYSDPMSNSAYSMMASSFSNLQNAHGGNAFVQAPLQNPLSSHASPHPVQIQQTRNLGNLQSGHDLSYGCLTNQAGATNYNRSSADGAHLYTNQQTSGPKISQFDSTLAYNLSGQQTKSVQDQSLHQMNLNLNLHALHSPNYQNQGGQPLSSYGTTISSTQQTPNFQNVPKDLINQQHQTPHREHLSDDLFSSKQTQFSQSNTSYFSGVNTQGSLMDHRFQLQNDLPNQASTNQFTTPQLQSMNTISQSPQSDTNPRLNSEFKQFNIQQANKQPPRF